MDLSDFAAREPTLLPERFFVGELQGWELEVGPLGGIGRRLQVTATGRFDDATQTLVLTEAYRFDDGHVDRLEWRIRNLGDGRYEAHELLLVRFVAAIVELADAPLQAIDVAIVNRYVSVRFNVASPRRTCRSR